MPWGGWKDSGIGFTHSKLGLLEMTRAKLINWGILPSRRNLWWFPYDRETYDSLRALLRFAIPGSAERSIMGGIRTITFIVKKMFTAWKAE